MKLMTLVKPTLCLGSVAVASTASWAVTKSFMTKEKEELKEEFESKLNKTLGDVKGLEEKVKYMDMDHIDEESNKRKKEYVIFIEDDDNESFCRWSGTLRVFTDSDEEIKTVNCESST
ncbi:hypothetical protein MHSWG343_10090 [Candidatus Mycoplasma haematohominis]|uniref:Uncharacterized protein n=1 Tax=Candidatus Mycoplasma haematohominis TaxID=1494318 RepID=A0A478FR30_9MOLU|nr:hypothetical protein MHSWG343_10090 [Candidatus Mycoplasma haemohominis]